MDFLDLLVTVLETILWKWTDIKELNVCFMLKNNEYWKKNNNWSHFEKKKTFSTNSETGGEYLVSQFSPEDQPMHN